MNFKIAQSVLLDALMVTGKAVAKSNTLAILTNYHFIIDGDRLEISGFNLQVFISKALKIEPSENQNFAVPAGRLIDIIKELPEQPLELTIDIRMVADKITLNLEIKSDCGTYNIPVIDGKDFPELKSTAESKLLVNSEELLKGLDKTLFACLNDQANPLSGVLISVENEEITYTGCNGNILSTCSFSIESKGTASCIVPVNVLKILQGLTLYKELMITLDKKSIQFHIDEHTLVKSTLFDGLYPDYKAVIPKGNDKSLSISRADLSGCLRRVSLFSETQYHLVTIDLSVLACAVIGQNELGERANETVKHRFEGDALRIGVNGRNFLNCLSKLGSEDVKITLSKPNKPVLIWEDGNENKPDQNLMLLMPLVL